MTRCKLCVMPDTRPDTQFIDGVCSACIAYDKRPDIDWGARRENLDELLDQHRGREYDCIVPSSGGKDSHYQVLTLLDMGAKPLVVTASTCHLTPIGRRNIDNLSRHADTLEITPNRSVRAKLNRLSLEMLGDPSWPEHISIHTTPFTVAADMQIPLVFYGENPTNQYGGPLARQDENQMTREWVAEFGGFLGMRPTDFIGIDGITARDMEAYQYDPFKRYSDSCDLEVHFLGQYIPWDSHQNARVAREAGMEQCLPSPANLWPHENLDSAQTGVHDFLMACKYGYGRGCAQASVDVRTGVRTRKSALAWIEKHDGQLAHNYAGVPLVDMLERIGLTVAQLREIAQEYKREAA